MHERTWTLETLHEEIAENCPGALGAFDAFVYEVAAQAISVSGSAEPAASIPIESPVGENLGRFYVRRYGGPHSERKGGAELEFDLTRALDRGMVAEAEDFIQAVSRIDGLSGVGEQFSGRGDVRRRPNVVIDAALSPGSVRLVVRLIRQFAAGDS